MTLPHSTDSTPLTSTNTQNIALFNMGGTICNYVGAMKAVLEKLRAPDEPVLDPFKISDSPDHQYLWDRMDLVKSDMEWWANLPKYQLGFDVLEMTTKWSLPETDRLSVD